MSLIASSIYNVADASITSVSVTQIVQPPVGVGTGGRGRLVHPTLGVYDYANTPTETVNVDGDVCFGPIWSHEQTIGGGVDTQWPGYMRDVVVVERWAQGDVGSLLSHLRQLWAFFANPPASGAYVLWSPNYANANTYRVAIVAVTAGGEEYKIDRWLADKRGYTPSPVEIKMRVLGYA